MKAGRGSSRVEEYSTGQVEQKRGTTQPNEKERKQTETKRVDTNFLDHQKLSNSSNTYEGKQNLTEPNKRQVKGPPVIVGNIRDYMIQNNTETNSVRKNDLPEKSLPNMSVHTSSRNTTVRDSHTRFDKIRRINKKGGRGFTRDEWIKHHEEIVKRSASANDSVVHNQQEMDIDVDDDGTNLGSTEEFTQANSSETDESTTTLQHTEEVIMDVDEPQNAFEIEASTETNKVQQKSCTSSNALSKTALDNFDEEMENYASEGDSDGSHSIHSYHSEAEQLTKASNHFSTESRLSRLVREAERKINQSTTSIDSSASESYLPTKTASNKDTSSNWTARSDQVEIKPELIDLAIHNGAIPVGSNVHTDDESSLFSKETEIGDDTSDLSNDLMLSQRTRTDALSTHQTVVKRKSDVGQNSPQQKRLQVDKRSRTPSRKSGPQINTADDKLNEETVLAPLAKNDSTKELIWQSHTTVESETYECKTTGVNTDQKTQNKRSNTGKYVPVNPTTVGEDSDSEWKTIARNIGTFPQNDPSHKSKKQGYGKPANEPRKGVRFSRVNTVLKSTTSTQNQTDGVLQRGIQMVDNRSTIRTPVKIEYNLDPLVREFNIITSVKELFEHMHYSDQAFKFLQSDTENVLWEEGSNLPESDDFTSSFQMREQNFRKGNSKVTIHGTVESNSTINRIKFTEPVKSFLLERNIWIKPDFYSTNTVSSPGFFTLVHPKLTNKKEFINHITESLRTTKLDKTEPTYTDWCEMSGRVITTEETPVPKFHVETNLRKWGDVQVETLNIYCSSNDAKYMKYLLSEASSQYTSKKGLYIPSGIHLMESKETLSKILQEHREFVTETTSFQVEGISYTDMRNTHQSECTIEDILLKGPGVKAVEPTYQTEARGQWILVITSKEAPHIMEYIQQHLPSIYKRKRGQQAKLVTHQINDNTKGYKFAMVDKISSTVGTYAEVLTRRFKNTTMAAGTTTPFQGQINHNLEQQTGKPGNTIEHVQAPMQENPRMQSKVPTGGRMPHNTGHHHTMEAETTTHIQDTSQIENTTQSPSTDTRNQTEGFSREMNWHSRGSTHNGDSQWQNKMQELEDKLSSHLTETSNTNRQSFSELEKKLTDKIDHILDSKMLDISLVNADLVTKRLSKAVGKIIKGTKHDPQSQGHDITDKLITQESPAQKQSHNANPLNKLEQTRVESGHKMTSTQKMLMELDNIQKPLSQTSDPPHDTIVTGSKVGGS